MTGAMAADKQSLSRIYSMDLGWRFHLGDLENYTTNMLNGGQVGENALGGGKTDLFEPEFDDSSWRGLNLPHDYTIEREHDQNVSAVYGALPMDTAWYRRCFDAPEGSRGKRFLLYFDGISRFSETFINGFHVRSQRFGTIGFSVDVTEAIRFDRKNVVAVRIDAAEGAEGWWYEGAGIYRHVWLRICNSIYIPRYGVAIGTTLNEGMDKGSLEVSTELCSEADEDKEVTVSSVVFALDGSEVVRLPEITSIIPSAKTVELSAEVDVDAPQLWSPDSPNLYTVKTSVLCDGVEIDSYEDRVGFRVFRFDKDEGFFINGKREVIKGVCTHQDHGGVGIAVPDALLKYRVQKLKAIGVNAFRIHHPSAPEVARLCDELGILFLAESRHFSCFSDSLEMLKEQIRQERNRACVVAWCIGNEEAIGSLPQAKEVALKMKRIARSLDPQCRPVTMGLHGRHMGLEAEHKGKAGALPALDIGGVNYDSNTLRSAIVKQPIFSSESVSMVATRGEYETDPDRGIVSSYDRKGVRWGQSGEELMDLLVNNPRIAGTFIWSGFDYHGEPTPYQWPNISSNFGLFDICGFRKDLSYFFEAWWSDHNVLHVFPHWNWKGTGKEVIDVWVYSNFDEVELLLNGRSLGRQVMPRFRHLEWKVSFEEGELVAAGYRNGELVRQHVVKTAGPEKRIVINASKMELVSDAQDVCVIDVSITDAEGVLCPKAENILAIEIDGPGRFIGASNGNPRSHEPSKLPFRKAFNGHAQFLVQSTDKSGVINVRVASSGLEQASVILVSSPTVKPWCVMESGVSDIQQAFFYPKGYLSGNSGNTQSAWSLEDMYRVTAGYEME